MGGCMSCNHDTDDKYNKYVCGVCHKKLGDRYLECTRCDSYLHYQCGRVGNFNLECCVLCGKKGCLIKRINLDLHDDRRNTI